MSEAETVTSAKNRSDAAMRIPAHALRGFHAIRAMAVLPCALVCAGTFVNIDSNLVIIAITCIVSIMAFNNAELVRQLILWPPAISRDKQYYRLLSYGLVHADPMHLFFNMFTLYFFGRAMAPLYTHFLGPLGFVIFYCGGLVASILPTYWRNRGNSRYRSLGASGAVSAALFAFILLQPWATIVVLVIPMPAILYAILYIVYEFYLQRQGADNVNHNAHLWGAAYGVLFTVLMEPRVLTIFLAQLSHPGFGLTP